MAEALSLSVSRKDQAERLWGYADILTNEGVSGLTSDELKELLLLDWLEQSGELEEVLSDAEIGKLAYHRIEEAKKRIDRGEAPFEPKRLAVWRWDPRKEEFVYTGGRQTKDGAGTTILITVKPEHLEGPNPYSSFREDEPGRRI